MKRSTVRILTTHVGSLARPDALIPALRSKDRGQPYDREVYARLVREAVSESEEHAFLDDCFAYDDLLRKNGHVIGGEALQSARNAVTLRGQNGKVSITDGPYAETKEQLGGFGVLEARDLNHAIQLMSKHPGVKAGPFEIRPAEDLTEMIHESERRRSRTKDK
mgnify:CR=1 FL=1